MSKVIVVFVTVGDLETAKSIARDLVEKHLAACVNIVSNVRSIYRWEGKVADDNELLLLIKTEEGKFNDLKDRILALHPYDLPEIIALNIEQAHQKYLDWVVAETRPG